LEKDNRRGNNRWGTSEERLRHCQTRGKDGEASKEPYIPLGTKGIKPIIGLTVQC
jgi:hypothetical protein